jgi:hypothetical protein
MCATIRLLKTIYHKLKQGYGDTVHVESLSRKLRGRKTWSTAPTCFFRVSFPSHDKECTCVAINRCSMYFDFGAASFTFVAPNQIAISTTQTTSSQLVGGKLGLDTFDRLFVRRRHPAHTTFSRPRPFPGWSSKDTAKSICAAGRAGDKSRLRTESG